MDMFEIGRTPATKSAAHVLRADGSATEQERWRELVAQIGTEIAAPLTAALERINALASTGKIDRAGLRALRDEVEAARQVGMTGQRLTHFASGRLRQSHEQIPLADVLNAVIAQRSRETTGRGIVVKPSLKPAEVIADASLLFTVLDSTVDWALANAHSQIDFAIDLENWPAHARLSCRFAHRPVEEFVGGAAASGPRAIDSLTWRLLEQTAWTMGLVVDRQDVGATTTLTLEFPRTESNEVEVEGVSALELNDGFALSTDSQPLAGSHVLVIASRRAMRVQIRDALRGMSLIIDFVNSVEEAGAFCREGLPHAVIIESIQADERFAHFREEIAKEVPDFVFIEIIEESTTFEMSGVNGSSIARVGREVLANSLPAALMFELSKSL